MPSSSSSLTGRPFQVVVGLGVSRRSSCSSGCCWGRIVEHISGLNYCCGLPSWSESLVWPASVRGGRPVPLSPPSFSSLTRRFFRRWLGWVFLVVRRAVRGAAAGSHRAAHQRAELLPQPAGPARIDGSARSCARGKASSAKSPVFLLAEEKVLGVVAGLVVSRRSSSRSGCCWGRIVEHISGLNYCCGLPAWSESLVWPAPVRGGRVDGGIGSGERRVWPAPVRGGRPVPLMPPSSSLTRRPCQVVARPGVSRRPSRRTKLSRSSLRDPTSHNSGQTWSRETAAHPDRVLGPSVCEPSSKHRLQALSSSYVDRYRRFALPGGGCLVPIAVRLEPAGDRAAPNAVAAPGRRPGRAPGPGPVDGLSARTGAARQWPAVGSGSRPGHLLFPSRAGANGGIAAGC